MVERILQRQDSAPSDARQVRSRKALTGAMLELLEQVPFDQLTIREITARAGTGYATFFRHYPDKETLLADVASQEIASLLTMTMPLQHSASSAQSTRALCHHVAEHAALWSALLTGGAAGILREEFIRQARGLAQASPPPDGWLPTDLAVVYGTGATVDLLAWWLPRRSEYGADQIAHIIDRLIIAPMMQNRSKAKQS